MPDLVIRIKKKTDGTAALSCTRADGSVTWQRQEGAQGRFFPLHDLTHYAVETVLGHREGFYGLLADGWEIGDFGAPWPRGPMPAATLQSEAIVGFLDAERAAGPGVRWTAADLALKSVAVSDADLARVREKRSELFARWWALPAGETLELEFSRPAR